MHRIYFFSVAYICGVTTWWQLDLPPSVLVTISTTVLLCSFFLNRVRSKGAYFALGIALSLIVGVSAERRMQDLTRQSIKKNHRTIGFVERVTDKSIVLRSHHRINHAELVSSNERILIFVPPGHQYNVGARLACAIKLNRPRRRAVAGTIDQPLFLLTRQIDKVGRAIECRLLHGTKQDAVRRHITSRLDMIQNPEAQAILYAMVLGEKYRLSDHTKTKFRHAGVYHVLVASGLHLGLLGTLVFFLVSVFVSLSLRFLQKIDRRKVSLLITVGLCFIYIRLLGMPLPILRAFCLLAATCIASIGNRPLHSIYALLVVGTLLLVYEPLWLFVPSFQFTMLATLAIVMAVKYLSKIECDCHPATRAGLIYGGIATAAFFVTLPLVVFYFHELSLFAILGNLFITPIIGWAALPIYVVSLIVSTISPIVGSGFASIAVWLVGLSVKLTEGLSELPLTHISVPSPHWLVICVYLGAFFLLFLRHSQTQRLRQSIFLALLVYVVVPVNLSSKIKGAAIDVGNGLAFSLVLNEGWNKRHAILFDTGSARHCTKVQSHLRSSGVRVLRAIYISHWDEDHYGCLNTLVRKFRVSNIYSSYVPNHIELPIRLQTMSEGEQHHYGEVVVDALFINDDLSASDNNRSLVLAVKIFDRHLVLPGDVEAKVEPMIIDRWQARFNSRPLILVAPHHGSFTSSTPYWVSALKPKNVIFSRRKSPASEVLQRYKRVGSKLWQTRQLGSIGFELDKKSLNLKGFSCDRQGRPLSGWGACP